MDYKHINCTAPSITTPETVELFITESGITNVSAGNYTFYGNLSPIQIDLTKFYYYGFQEKRYLYF